MPCSECDVRTKCRVLVFSKSYGWGDEPHFDFAGCEFDIVGNVSAFTSYLCAIKSYKEEEHPPPTKEKFFRENIQKEKIVFDCALEKAQDMLGIFGMKNGKFPQAVILLERNESNRTFSLSILRGRNAIPEIITERSNLVSAIEQTLKLRFA